MNRDLRSLVLLVRKLPFILRLQTDQDSGSRSNYSSGKWTASQIPGAEFIEMKAICYFPMSENYPVFKQYLQQAL